MRSNADKRRSVPASKAKSKYHSLARLSSNDATHPYIPPNAGPNPTLFSIFHGTSYSVAHTYL